MPGDYNPAEERTHVGDGYVDGNGNYYKRVGEQQGGEGGPTPIYEKQSGKHKAQYVRTTGGDGGEEIYKAVPVTETKKSTQAAPAQKSFEQRVEEAKAAERAKFEAEQKVEQGKEIANKKSQAASESKSLGKQKKLSTATVLGNRKEDRRRAYLGLLGNRTTRGKTLLGVKK